jgi:hypothetical protein
MRWRFPDPADLHEAENRARIRERIDAWWRAFAAASSDIDAALSGSSPFDLAKFIQEQLTPVHPQLRWEFGPALRSGRRLVLTPEGNHELRPLLSELLARAPTLPGWEFYPYRLPESPARLAATVQARVGQPLPDLRVCVEPEEGGVHLTYCSARLSSLEEKTAHQLALAVTEGLLGEERLNNFVDAIQVAAQPAGPDISLPELVNTVDALVRAQRDELPPRGFLDDFEGREWTVLEGSPPRAADYLGQSDLLVTKTCDLPLWKRAHSGRVFSSARFSRCGELFAYVKIDGSEGLDPRGFLDKAEIEDALNATLRRDGLGTCIGGGTGLRYSYFDLALADVDRALPAIRRVLRGGRVPKRSWLLFFDSDLAQEWVGVWEDTPEPPGLPIPVDDHGTTW